MNNDFFGESLNELETIDKEIFRLIEKEKERQLNTIGLIASENLTSKAVLQATSSVLTNKYSEGYPKKRYYAGNAFIDEIEETAIERAKKLFQAEHANVQPHSGTGANMAAYYAFLETGDKFMGMKLSHGGHLSHGHNITFSGKYYQPIQYTVSRETELLDYDEIRKIALKEKPKLILSGYTAYSRKIDFKEFSEIAQEVNAFSMADIAHISGLCCTGLHPNPAKFADVVTTTTQKMLRGPRGGIILCKEEFGEKIDKAVFPALQGGPFEHIIAAKAVCFKEAMAKNYSDYCEQIIKNAKVLASELQRNGFRIVTGGTDNHLMLVDLTKKDISGKEAEELLQRVGIIVNKNTIPFDEKTPFNPSGIRIGTPTVTTRGMKESEMTEIGEIISKTIEHRNNSMMLEKMKNKTIELCKQFQEYS